MTDALVIGLSLGCIYGFVALGYFLLCYPLSLAAYRLERRLNVTA